jgi:hypothetical protein
MTPADRIPDEELGHMIAARLYRPAAFPDRLRLAMALTELREIRRRKNLRERLARFLARAPRSRD